MKLYKAKIDIMPHKELLDPQGKTVAKNIGHMNIQGIKDVRIGKHIDLLLEAADEQSARALIQQSCEKLLINPITESYTYTVAEQ